MACFVAVEADADSLDVGIVVEHLPQNLVRYTARSRIAVVSPAGLIHGNVRQKIHRGFEEIESVGCSHPVKAVTGQAAGCVAFVGGLGAASTLVGVPGLLLFVLANENNIVVLGGLVDQSAIAERIQHILIDPSLAEKISIDPAHIVVLFRELEFLCRVGSVGRDSDAAVHGKHEADGILIGIIVEMLGERDGITTKLFVLVIPYISANGYLLAVAVPLELRARGLDDLTALAEKGDQVSLPRLLPLFFGEGDIVCDGVHLHKIELRPNLGRSKMVLY